MHKQSETSILNLPSIAEDLLVIKIGGNIIDDEAKLAAFLILFAKLPGKKILVHGGGKLATKLAAQLNLPQQMVEGRRLTDAETLKVVTMVYAGLVNKTIVAGLQAAHCNAIGLSGADANVITAHKRQQGGHDWGFVGDVEAVKADCIHSFLQQNLTPVLAPVTHNGNGQLLNTNADTIAQETAKAMSRLYKTTLIYSFEKAGVLVDAEDETTVIKRITPSSYQQLKVAGNVYAGMIPKLDNAFAALDAGVGRVIIGKAEDLPSLIMGSTGTSIVNE